MNSAYKPAVLLGVGQPLAKKLLLSGALPVHHVGHRSDVVRHDSRAWLDAAPSPIPVRAR